MRLVLTILLCVFKTRMHVCMHWSVDVRNIVSDDDSLTPGVLPALREYNLAQFATTQVPGHQHSVRFILFFPLCL